MGKQVDDFLTSRNKWLTDKLKGVTEKDEYLDAELEVEGEKLSVNISVMPLLTQKNDPLGVMVMIEDISSEKRMKSTMSRYMDPELADQLLEAGDSDDFLGGKQSVGTVLFSDVRSFTTITEELGAQGTVKLLNEYFTIMVDCIADEGGMLDKFIGDAMMCIFGTPVPPPPPDVPPLVKNDKGKKLTVKESLEKHRDHTSCAACHNLIDPVGFALDLLGSLDELPQL